jgi:formate hydrogenlyase transcriptional activator
MSRYQPLLHQWFIHLIKSIVQVNNREELEKELKRALTKVDLFEEIILCLPESSGRYLPMLLKPSTGMTSLQRQTLADAANLPGKDGFLPRIKSLQAAIVLSPRADRENRKVVAAPVWYGATEPGFLLFYCRQPSAGFENELEFANSFPLLLSAKLSHILANETIALQKQEIVELKKKLSAPAEKTHERTDIAYKPDEIIGAGPSMRKISHMVSQVATRSSTVLILGETGTGKELIARAVHNQSARRNMEMIKVNCASLPANLIESELFGHEKGSFTGAIERRIGKFELANNSSLFLDEVGEMPPELQIKLLRALQEGEIDRIGGKSTIKVNVRLIAATNRDLMEEVKAGRFRSDLYFRLNVFPIVLSALRDRKEDIPLLARHFLQKYAARLKIPVTRISSKTMKQLIAYNWPGNIRELEHIIERSVLLSKGKVITHVPLPGLNDDESGPHLQNTRPKTLQDIERAHILAVLKMTNGKVSGIGGAAELLKIPSTTLSSKMKKLKIRREPF